jgi:hypothetical protein
MKRTRKIVAKDDDSKCPKTVDVRECEITKCPVNCKFTGKWGRWSKCTAKCGGGKKTRTRPFVSAKFGGKGCKNKKQTRNCNTKPCPVDCKVTKFGGYGKCSKKCGGGVRKAFRTITQKPMNGGKRCPSFTKSQKCNTHGCAVDCKITWGKWNACSTTCGKGVQTRAYKLRKAANGGKTGCGIKLQKQASSYGKNYRSCNVKPCPVHCQTNDWELWTACSKTCGGGKRIRTRNVIVKAQFGGKSCGALKQTQKCNKARCAIDCVTSDWTKFSKCTRACGKGEMTRTRHIVTRPMHGGKACGTRVQHQFCNTQKCTVNCAISAWGPYTGCSAKHGEGTKTRTRSIAAPAKFGGKRCKESRSQVTKCFEGPKAQNCKVSAWSKFGACSAKCGVGSMKRSRSVISRGKGVGVQCPWLNDKRDCQIKPCAVDCVLGKNWSPFTQCSKSCGTGMRAAVRRIVKSAHSGGLCQNQRKVKPCNKAKCPVDCKMSSWSGFTDCTKTCGNGKHFRNRKVLSKAAFGGKTCGHVVEQAFCNTKPCPVDCKITKWSKWSKCSKKCEGGKQVRKALKHTSPLFAGRSCAAKELKKTQKCNTQKCAIDCKVTGWKKNWSKCTRTCGGGVQHNYRQIATNHKYGGKKCPALERSRFCSKKPCPVDCKLSGWNKWSKCSQHCGGGIKARVRTVKTHASAGGKKCPNHNEIKRCNTQPCHWKESPAPMLDYRQRYTVWFTTKQATTGKVSIGFVGGNGVSKMYHMGKAALKKGSNAVSIWSKSDIGLLSGIVLKATDGAVFKPAGFINVKTPSGQVIQFAGKTVTRAMGVKATIPEEGKTATPMAYTVRIRTGKHAGKGSYGGLFVKFHGSLGESRFYKMGTYFKNNRFYQKTFKITEWVGKLEKISFESTGTKGLQIRGTTLVKTPSHKYTGKLIKFKTNFWLGRAPKHTGHQFFEKTVKAVAKETQSYQKLLEVNDAHKRNAALALKALNAAERKHATKKAAPKKPVAAKPVVKKPAAKPAAVAAHKARVAAHKAAAAKKPVAKKPVAKKPVKKVVRPTAPPTIKITAEPTPALTNSPTVKVTASPTRYPTSEPTAHPMKQCSNGGNAVQHGWHGAGFGKNYCNFCKCNDGKLTCTTRACGKPAALPKTATKCKHTTCEYTRAVAGKTTSFAAKHVQVNHHHKEGRQNHRCAYNPFSQQCTCFCWV